MHSRIFYLALILVLLILLNFLPYALAAEGGARPLAMGGAFIGLADDAHAASWNPAGMAWEEQQEITYTGILMNRSDYIIADFASDDYLSFVTQLKGGYARNFKSRGVLGVNINHSSYKMDNIKFETYQPSIAYARLIKEDMSWGIGLNYYDFDSQIDANNLSDNDWAIGINLGYLWYMNDYLSLGILWENINEPKYSLFGVTNRLLRNLRPGIAYYFDEHTVFTLDIYDLSGNTKDKGSNLSQNIRIGMEHDLTKNIILRGGGHHPFSDSEASTFYAFGLGTQRSNFVGVNPITYYLDYTFIYWPEVQAGIEKYTHQLGLTIRF